MRLKVLYPYFDKVNDAINCNLPVNGFYGLDLFYSTEYYFDIIHIDFFESLCNWSRVETGFIAIDILKRRKEQGTKIVFVKHNNTVRLDNLFDSYIEFIKLVDVFVSLNPTEDNYVPHQSYYSIKHYKQTPRDKFSGIVPGLIRDKKEAEIVDHFSKLLNCPIKTLGYSHKIISIKDAELIDAVNDSNFVLIPRYNCLNSGILFLGMSLGRKVIYPKVGNLDSQALLGNYSYNPYRLEEFSKTKEDLVAEEPNNLHIHETNSVEIKNKKLLEIYTKLC